MVKRVLILSAVLAVVAVSAIALMSVLKMSQPATNTVPHEGKYGIYTLDPETGKVALIYSTFNEMYTSALRLNNHGGKFVFAQKIDGTSDRNTEIFTIGVDGRNLQRLTSNSYWDLYPAWSPDDSQIAFISNRTKDFDVYVMNADGTNNRNITPDYFPLSFLCYSPVFSQDDSKIYFIGQWQQ